MELFDHAKAVRLRSYHGKYLKADEDEEHVTQSRNGSAPGARWEVEFLPDCPTFRLRSCHGRYLAASAEHFLLGFTGKKVVQLQFFPSLDPNPPCLKWEPIREGFQVKLKSHTGKFLRANGSLPPWRNSVTHDLPQHTATQDWVLWDVDVVEIQSSSAPARAPAVSIKRSPSPPSSPPRPFAEDFSSPSGPSDPDELREVSSSSTSSSMADSSPRANAIHSPPSSTSQRSPSLAAQAPVPAPSLGRTIYYTVADDRGNVDDHEEWPSLTFVGTSVPELTLLLKKLTMIDDIIVCTRHPLKHNLSPIYLHLPPNNRAMRLVVVDADSSFGRSFDI
ncbi:uncharacterized protein LOC121997852 [Zingiber officinale]|uniref:uncharacterized protein LOC121997852 n=1 Tax=Zingiber officinale TaxID=94328 RepID=UPI001C4A7697|nr:uncharacterized protein LOC121997852 [Zingiber officinale]XP_042408442.1 uncharacterized protein LOC121997852 [Zingiber officinale]